MRSRESVLHAEVDRETDAGRLASCATSIAPRPRRRSRRRSRTGRRCAHGRASSPTSSSAARRRSSPAERRRESGLPALARRRPLHVPRLPRVRARASEGGEARRCSAVPGTGLGSCARSAADAAQAPDARARAGARASTPHVLVLTKANSRATVHRPSYLDYVGVKLFGRRRPGRRRAPLPRALHDARLQGARAAIPILRGKVEQRARTRRLRARQPRPQGAARDPRVLPARRAVADRDR